MRTMVKKEYDPHLLYQAINITAELKYKVPMQRVYDIIEAASKNTSSDGNCDVITPQNIIDLLGSLGGGLEKTILENEQIGEDSLQSKIKELLRLLNCSLSNQELNKILKGELSIDDVLSKQAKTLWHLVFDIDEHGKSRPNQQIVDQLMLSAHLIAIEDVELKIQQNMEIYRKQERKLLINEGVLNRSDNAKTLHRSEKEMYDPIALDKKRTKLKLYIAHMQGYDRDRDRDGGRGIDMTTGEIIDFGDIYIADKEHGSIIEDINRDGIDIADIK